MIKFTLLMILILKNEIFSKLKMIGFSEVEIDPDGYESGKLNIII